MSTRTAVRIREPDAAGCHRKPPDRPSTLRSHGNRRSSGSLSLPASADGGENKGSRRLLEKTTPQEG
ncbi:hypothetical protein MRX96_000674 [Rhipicephalus microplus]